MSMSNVYARILHDLAHDASIQGSINIVWHTKTRWTVFLNDVELSTNLSTSAAINLLVTLISFQTIIRQTAE